MDATFSQHVAASERLLAHRAGIVERIERTLLNVRGKPAARNRSRRFFQQTLESCFSGMPGVPREVTRLGSELEARHVADGFEPVRLDAHADQLDPLELVVRAYEYWDAHRWPGTSGRLTFAQTIYAVRLLRRLEHLSLRIWDDGLERAEAGLADVQHLLDDLNAGPVPGALVRDARWLVQTAQGPLTLQLAPYFATADRIAASFTPGTRLGLHAAGARLAGGHLRSQLRYRARDHGQDVGGLENLAVARNSNAMDVALLVRDLVALLEAYADLLDGPANDSRLDVADAILQGLSADPELLLVRLDLLGPLTTIETLFVAPHDDGSTAPTETGRTHAAVLARYGELIGALAPALIDDAGTLDPAGQPYSPLGVTYGFVSDVLSAMATGTLLAQPALGLTLEDLFVSRDRLEEKRARVTAWQALPRRPGEREPFSLDSRWAGENHARVLDALALRARHASRANASETRNARVYVTADSEAGEALPADAVQANDYCFTSDVPRALAHDHTGCTVRELITDRNEGRYLASVEAGGHWFGVSKVILTLFTSQGRDVLISDVPDEVTDILQVTCPDLVVAFRGSRS